MRRDHLYIFHLMSCIFVVLGRIDERKYDDLFYYLCKLISYIVWEVLENIWKYFLNFYEEYDNIYTYISY